MTYDDKLADRIRGALPPSSKIEERKMFGGLAFLLDGKMFIGVADRDLMVRVGADGHEAALAEPHVRPMDFTGRPLTGFIYVGPAGTGTTDAVAAWVEQAIAFVATLPIKAKKTPKKAAQRSPRRSHRRRAPS